MGILDRYKNNLLVFAIPITIFIASIGLVYTSAFGHYTSQLSNAIVLDLLLTIPFFYYLSIRKKDIPRITIASVFILCMLTASIIIPKEDQSLLTQIKGWAIPLVELIIFAYLVIHARKTIQEFKQSKDTTPDFFTAITHAAKTAFPARVVPLLAFEISVVYYALFKWGKRTLAENEFTYYKKSGIIATVSAMMFLVVAETFVVHILLTKSFPTLALVLSLLSIYTCLQLIALIRSFAYRPTFIDTKERKIYLRYGFFNETIIDIDTINSITKYTKSLPDDNSILQFSALGMLDTHNIVLHLDKENVLNKMYGMKKKFTTLAIFIDDYKTFIASVMDEMKLSKYK